MLTLPLLSAALIALATSAPIADPLPQPRTDHLLGPLIPASSPASAEPWKIEVFSAGRDRIKPAALGGYDPGWVPVRAYVLEHPRHGTVVFDTGLNHRAAVDPSYLCCMSRVVISYDLHLGEDLPAQMRHAGLQPEAVHLVVLSHLHADHTGEAAAFPNAEIWYGAADRQWASREGALRSVHAWEFDPLPHVKTIGFSNEPPYGPFAHHRDVFPDGSLVLVPLPGHSPGSLGLVVQTASGPVILAGDAYPSRRFADWVLANGETGSLQSDRQAMQASLKLLAKIQTEQPGVAILGGHEDHLPDLPSSTLHAVEPPSAPSPWDYPRASLLAVPAMARVPGGGVAGVVGGLGYDVLPCLSIDAITATSQRVGGTGRTFSATGLEARYNWALGPGLYLGLSAGPGMMFTEGRADGTFEQAPGALLVGASLERRLSGLDLSWQLAAATPLGPGTYAWPPFQFMATGPGIGLRF